MDFGVDLAVIGFRQQQFSVPHFSRYVETAKGMYITKKNSGTDRVIAEVLAPMLNGSADEIRRRLLVGSPHDCARNWRGQRCRCERVFI
jgi:hypothetical protein